MFAIIQVCLFTTKYLCYLDLRVVISLESSLWSVHQLEQTLEHVHGKDDFMHKFINKSGRSKMWRLITYGNQCEECSTNV